jgi:hypothetical protein
VLAAGQVVGPQVPLDPRSQEPGLARRDGAFDAGGQEDGRVDPRGRQLAHEERVGGVLLAEVAQGVAREVRP